MIPLADVRLSKVNKIFSGRAPAARSWWQFWKPAQVSTEVHVVQDADLHVQDGEFLVLVGPSGCGKSTTLRMIAGLEDISSGQIHIGERLVNEVSPKDRDIAMVFQNYALYPHMKVYDNMAFGLRLRKFATQEIDRRVKDAAGLLGIDELLERKPRELSGGQRQRVAMGRAIVRRPKVYLMDEPLSNLDAKLRVQMRAELQKLHRQLGVTTVYVTHDQTEAMTLGDRIVIMKDGVIQQIDTPLSLYEQPANRFVAGFIGSPGMNFVPVRLESNEAGRQVVAGNFQCNLPAASAEHLFGRPDGPALLGLRPQDLREARGEVGGQEVRMEATVEVLEPLGSENYLYCLVGEDSLVARVEPHSNARVGDRVELAARLDRFHLFCAETGVALLHPHPHQSSEGALK